MNKHKNNDNKSKSIVYRKQRKYDSKRKSSNYTELILSSLGNAKIQELMGSGLLQAKLNISQPGDPFEQQADKLAEQMVNNDSVDNIQKTSVDRVQTRENSGGKGTNHTETEINNLKGQGTPMEPPVRNYFQNRFGLDLGDVRIHTGSTATKLTKAVNARAFTRGNDIVFKEGEYSPETAEGKKLLAHELVHTVQQGATRKKANGKVTHGEAEPICLPSGKVHTARDGQPIQRKTADINGLPENLLKDQTIAQVKDIIEKNIAEYNKVAIGEDNSEVHINYLRRIENELKKVIKEKTKTKKSTEENKVLIKNLDNYLKNEIQKEFEAVSEELTNKGEKEAYNNRDEGDQDKTKNESPPFAVIRELIKKKNGALEVLAKYGYNWFTAQNHLAKIDYAKDIAEYKERTKVMKAMVDYRNKQTKNLLKDLIKLGLTEINAESRNGKREVKEKGSNLQGMVDGKVLIEALVPGSDSITSDIDITFKCKKNAAFEVNMVKYYNTISRRKFGRPTGTLFDVNAYTSGFMSKESGHNAKKDRKSTGQIIRIGNVINKKNETQVVLGILPVREFFGENKIASWNDFCKNTIKNLGTELEKLIDDYSTLIQGKPSNATEHLKGIFKEANLLYKETSDTLQAEKPLTETENKQNEELKGEFSDNDVELMASNKLYEKELDKVKKLLEDRDNILKNIEKAAKDKDKLKSLRKELVNNKKAYDKAQGKALVYSNEAYYNAGAVIHVVKGSQLGENVKLASQQLVESILMNIGYKLKHFEEEMENNSVRGAVVKTSKYGDRIGDAMKDMGILKKLGKEEIKTLELEKEIQRNYKKNEGYKSPAAREAMAEKKLTEKKFKHREVSKSYIKMASQTLILSYTKPIEDFVEQKNTNNRES